MSFQTRPIWDLLSEAKDEYLAARAPEVEDAFTWLVQNPEIHRTPVRLVITSDWAEFALYSPSAYIEKDPKWVNPGTVLIEPTKVNWLGGQGVQREFTIEFVPTQRSVKP